MELGRKKKGSSWRWYTGYALRFIDFSVDGATVHLKLIKRFTVHTRPRVEVTWTTSKFKGVKFDFQVHMKTRESRALPFGYGKRSRHGPDWKEVFRRLRLSLAYGLNQNSRAVTDRLLQIKEGEKNPIHNMVRTSRGLQ